MAELGMSWTEAWLTVITATVIYFVVIALSRAFGQRQFATSSTYDLAFVFAIGSVVGRVVLVRTSLATAILGLGVMFTLHAAAGWLHHHVAWIHDLMQNKPILVVANAEIVAEGMQRAHLSEYELFQALRLDGRASLEGIHAVVLERNGQLSIIEDGAPLSPDVMQEIIGRERLPAIDRPADR